MKDELREKITGIIGNALLDAGTKVPREITDKILALLPQWTRVSDRLPEDFTKHYFIKHYNDVIEVARFDGVDWHAISPRFDTMDEKLSKEGWPDYWFDSDTLPRPPKER